MKDSKNKQTQHYDVIVIGDGSGATLARKLAQFGFKTALIGEGRPGGTCLNRGCIPSKKLIGPVSKLYSSLKTLKKYTEDETFQRKKVLDYMSFTDLKREVFQEVYADSINSKQNMEEGNVENLTYINAHVEFLNSECLVETNKPSKEYTFDKIVLATGSTPRVPHEIEGIENISYDTSTEALFSQEEIQEYTILGGGVIGSEIATLYAMVGIDVTLLSTGQILRPVDDMLKKDIEKYMQKLGIKIIKNISVDRLEEKNSSIVVEYSHQKLSQTHITSRMLIALGVTPSTQKLGLENTNIGVNKRGFIETNSKFQINDSTNFFAIGDCSGKSLLRHGASFESREVFKQIALKSSEVLSQEYMPSGIYLGESEIGSCGKTSQQLKELKIPFKTHTKKFEDTVYGKAKGLRGKIVLHYHTSTYEILGCHIFGPDGVNLNQIAVPYIEKHQTLFDMADTICPHPSLAEAIFTIPIRELVYDILHKTFKNTEQEE